MRFIVTGANRGIGRELTRQLTARGDEVIAAVRDPDAAAEIQSIGAALRRPEALSIRRCDVASDASVAELAEGLKGEPIDVLINNAGVMGALTSIDSVNFDDVIRTFNVNAAGALRVTRALLPNLRAGEGRKIVHISSGMGSIGDNTSGGAYAYRMSKAALNMASKSLAVDLRGERILSVVMNPGWVATDMGGRGAPTSVVESVSKMLGLIDRLKLEDSGQFFDYRGHTLMY